MSETSTRLRATLQGAQVVATVVALLAASSCSGAGGYGRADTWQADASAAITPMAQRIPTMALEASEWQQGTLDAGEYRSDLATTLAVMIQARDRVVKLPPYPGKRMVDRLYLASMTLYVASTQADQASLGTEDQGLRRQVALMAERVRELGDRVFDQGRLMTGQSLVPAGLSGAKVDLPSAVPDWTAEGLAAGPPIASAPAVSVVRPQAEATSGPEVRQRLSQLVMDEAQLALRGADLAGGVVAGPLRSLASELTGAGRLVG